MSPQRKKRKSNVDDSIEIEPNIEPNIRHNEGFPGIHQEQPIENTMGDYGEIDIGEGRSREMPSTTSILGEERFFRHGNVGCHGCDLRLYPGGCPNQEAHMDYGGCLSIFSSDDDDYESVHTFTEDDILADDSNIMGII